MNKIKITTILIFILAISMIVLSISINQDNKIHNNILKTINDQKNFTQEISKNIFYIYKNKNTSSQLDNIIKEFIKNMDTNNKQQHTISSNKIKQQNQKIFNLWNTFYSKVANFKKLNKIATPYSSIILEQTLKDIYNLNIKLVVEFDKLIEIQQENFKTTIQTKKNIQYMLFIVLLSLLIYLFTQQKTTISFIQKFLNTSKNIITNSSIEDLKPIEVKTNTNEILQATNNFNFLVQKINNSIENSSKSIKHSYNSIELLEQNIEELLELFYEMQEDKELDKEMTKREDILIQSLEELTTSATKLQNLKIDLDNLIAQK